MPELPEVETTVRLFRAGLTGRRILDFKSHWPRQVTPPPAAAARALRKRKIRRVWRRAKFIVCDLDPGGHLLIHLRMSGRLEWGAARGPAPLHTRAEFRLDDGRVLLFVDARKFGRILVTEDLESATAGLGLEPFSRAFTPQRLAALLAGRARRIKPLLLDQSFIAGLGNIYADEALFAARLHPLSRADCLSAAQIQSLHGAIRSTLSEGIRRNGATIDWVYPGGEMQHHLFVYGRGGQPCEACGGTIVATRVAQRGTSFCPSCQTLVPDRPIALSRPPFRGQPGRRDNATP